LSKIDLEDWRRGIIN